MWEDPESVFGAKQGPQLACPLTLPISVSLTLDFHLATEALAACSTSVLY